MDEQILNEILASYRDAINALIERIDAQDEMVKAVMEKTNEVEKLLFDEVINPAKEAMEKSIYDSGLEDFSAKYGEKLEGYNEKLRPIEGQDFDIMKEAYDGYNEYKKTEDVDEDTYVDELVKIVDNQLDGIRSALGIPEDAEVAVVNEDGETKVEVDGEEVDTDAEAKEEEKPEEEPASEEKEKEEEVITDDEEAESDPEDLAALEEELLKYAK